MERAEVWGDHQHRILTAVKRFVDVAQNDRGFGQEAKWTNRRECSDAEAYCPKTLKISRAGSAFFPSRLLDRK
jgi:hypothetical protein